MQLKMSGKILQIILIDDGIDTTSVRFSVI